MVSAGQRVDPPRPGHPPGPPDHGDPDPRDAGAHLCEVREDRAIIKRIFIAIRKFLCYKRRSSPVEWNEARAGGGGRPSGGRP